jgi:hypothetical protein
MQLRRGILGAEISYLMVEKSREDGDILDTKDYKIVSYKAA